MRELMAAIAEFIIVLAFTYWRIRREARIEREKIELAKQVLERLGMVERER